MPSASTIWCTHTSAPRSIRRMRRRVGSARPFSSATASSSTSSVTASASEPAGAPQSALRGGSGSTSALLVRPAIVVEFDQLLEDALVDVRQLVHVHAALAALVLAEA